MYRLYLLTITAECFLFICGVGGRGCQRISARRRRHWGSRLLHGAILAQAARRDSLPCSSVSYCTRMPYVRSWLVSLAFSLLTLSFVRFGVSNRYWFRKAPSCLRAVELDSWRDRARLISRLKRVEKLKLNVNEDRNLSTTKWAHRMLHSFKATAVLVSLSLDCKITTKSVSLLVAVLPNRLRTLWYAEESLDLPFSLDCFPTQSLCGV